MIPEVRMAGPFTVRVVVRGYELDTQGHLNQAVYLSYSEHARWELLLAAGITQDALLEGGVGPVALETTIRYRRELRGGDEVDVSCEFAFGERRTFQLKQDITRVDGVLAAEIVAVAGLLDLSQRKLVPDPAARLRSLATTPDVLGV
jgi:acyl-CoA thioester hydrolase